MKNYSITEFKTTLGGRQYRLDLNGLFVTNFSDLEEAKNYVKKAAEGTTLMEFDTHFCKDRVFHIYGPFEFANTFVAQEKERIEAAGGRFLTVHEIHEMPDLIMDKTMLVYHDDLELRQMPYKDLPDLAKKAKYMLSHKEYLNVWESISSKPQYNREVPEEYGQW